jgi:hypothetical protein
MATPMIYGRLRHLSILLGLKMGSQPFDHHTNSLLLIRISRAHLLLLQRGRRIERKLDDEIMLIGIIFRIRRPLAGILSRIKDGVL